jgi:hypothetical protein
MGRLTMFEPPRFPSTRPAAPESTAPPIVAGALPVTAGVLLTVEGALIEGLLTTGAGGTMGAAGTLPAGAGVLLMIEGVPVASGGAPDTEGVVPTGEGVVPLIAGAAGAPVAGALVCARAGTASIAAAMMRQVRAFMTLTSLCGLRG